MHAAAPPLVNEALLKDVVRRILTVSRPLKIVLFGSQARGTAHARSDLDLLVVERSSDLPRYKRSLPYRMALLGLDLDQDIEVWTPAEIAEWSQVPMAFVTTILREGRVLYEEPA
jgi:predicted nucleotidyltransferase